MRKRKYQGMLLIFLLSCVAIIGSGFPVSATSENYDTDDELAINLAGNSADGLSGNIQLIDQAGLLTEAEAEDVEAMIEKLEDKTGWDVMAVTTEDAEGMTAQYYAEKWFDDYTTCDDGFICLIDMDNREIQLRTFGEAIQCLNDSRRDRILDSAYEKVSNEEYAETFQVMIQKTGKYAYRQITVIEALIALVAALAAGGITVGGIVGSYRLKFGGYKYPIEKNGSVNLRKKEDAFVNQFVTHRHIPKSDGSSGGSGKTTTHVGAGGRTSGGGGRKF